VFVHDLVDDDGYSLKCFSKLKKVKAVFFSFLFLTVFQGTKLF